VIILQVNLQVNLQIVWLIIAILLVVAILYISTYLVHGVKETNSRYMLSLFIVAIIAILAIPALTRLSSVIGLPQIGPYIIFVSLLYTVKYLLKPTRTSSLGWEKAVWISFITIVFIYLLNMITGMLFGVEVIPQF